MKGEGQLIEGAWVALENVCSCPQSVALMSMLILIAYMIERSYGGVRVGVAHIFS